MNIIIPLGGSGVRFQKDNYYKPKPLINVLGKEMIFWVLDCLKLEEDDNVYIVYNNNLKKWNFAETVLHRYPKTKLVELDTQTEGAAETLLIGLENFNKEDLIKKTIALDGDTFYTIDILSKFRPIKENAIFYFEDDQDKPIFSYIKLDDDNNVEDVKEKVKISNNANTGCYCFSSGIVLKKYCQKLIEKNIKQRGEYYTSGIIGLMIEDDHKFKGLRVGKSEFHCVGTPNQLKIFSANNYSIADKRRICFDLDNTLVTYPKVVGDYTTVEPIQKNINLCNYLKNLGHTIIIYTARRMRTHGGNTGKIIQEVGKITLDTLDKFNIQYDEIYFGKPYAHFYIDDLAVNTLQDIEKEIGFYNSHIEERKFNVITNNTIKTIVKESKEDVISGEIYWYRNIPDSIQELFPVVYKYNGTSYEMEKIDGITLSYLYVNNSLTTKMLEQMLEKIEIIHNSLTEYDGINIYTNYLEKIKNRYSSYDYSSYPNSSDIYHQLANYFRKYQEEDLGKISVIHGDPVFTNIFLDKYGCFKFIDMRGKMGETLTIFGDKWYDYGKIYQSLIGYDEVLTDKFVTPTLKVELIGFFEEYVRNKFGEDVLKQIKMITKSLLFTLIPLHANDKCIRYYHLINSIQ